MNYSPSPIPPHRPPNPLLQENNQPTPHKFLKVLRLVLIVILLALLCVLVYRAYQSYQENPHHPFGIGDTLEVYFLDVGQADSALITCGDMTMLIDGGNVGDGQKLYSLLKERNISTLDYVICTHAHEDHVGGLASALTACTAEVVYSPVTDYDSRAFRNFAEKAGKITVPRPGDTFSFGSGTAEILACDPYAEEANNTSIVMKLTFGKTTFLFTGDAETPVEQTILDSGYDPSATVLKVGHHGSSSSTSYRFLNEVMPQYAVISVGEDNSYDHPNDDVLSRLRDADVKVYRTDLDGDILCISDGKKVTFSLP